MNCPQFSFKGVESCVKQDISHCFQTSLFKKKHGFGETPTSILVFPVFGCFFFVFFPGIPAWCVPKTLPTMEILDNFWDPLESLPSIHIQTWKPQMEPDGQHQRHSHPWCFHPWSVEVPYQNVPLAKGICKNVPDRSLAGAHSQASDGAELPFVFAKLALAPAFTGKQPLSRDKFEWNGRR